MTTRVLFVDDEANVLSGLRRMLRSQSKVWNMNFAGGGEEAIAFLETQSVDVIVTDMRMPGIDGAELLAQVSRRWPQTIRLVLSGQSEYEKIFRAIGPAHQFLSKPCDPDRLIETIRQACALQDHLGNESLHRVTSQIESLPSLPTIYRELVQELDSDEASLDRVGEIIGSDLAMSAKILQLVNSSFFGLPHHVTCPKHAVSMLGLGILRPLALSAGAFSQYDEPEVPGYSLTAEIEHGLAVAIAARKIAKQETNRPDVADDAFIAGMMHDLGKLILAVHLSDVFVDVVELAKHTDLTFWQAEKALLGTTHAAVGAHLLGLWGLPNPIVEAVAFHHEPSTKPPSKTPTKTSTNPSTKTTTDFTPLTAVHAANVIGRCGDDPQCRREKLDVNHLDQVGVADHLASWSQAIQSELTL